jgi:peptidoglycan/LPS O-acetylase OafA/YrhL
MPRTWCNRTRQRHAPTRKHGCQPANADTTPEFRRLGERWNPAAVFSFSNVSRPCEGWRCVPVSPAASQAPNQTPKSLPGLTGLRGLAALWVVLYHYCSLYLPALDAGWLGGLMSRGYLAVDLFFLLSGFVLAHVYSDAAERKGFAFFRAFMRARVARIYPLHLLVLALFVAMAFAVRGIHYVKDGYYYPLPLSGPRSLEALVANVLMLQGLKASDLSWNYPAWSISVEFAAYLVFPLAIGLLWRLSGRSLTVATFAAFAAIWALAYVAGGDMNQWDGPMAIWRCLPQFSSVASAIASIATA